MYVGLDISKKKTIGIWKDKKGRNISEETFATNREGLNKLIEKLDKNCKVVLESSTSGVFVYDYLTENGIPVKVSNPTLTKLISHSDKKTDRTDAEKLVDLNSSNRI